MRRYWLAALLAGCVDFRQGLACAEDRDCVGYACVSGVCEPPLPEGLGIDAGAARPDSGIGSQGFPTSTGGSYTLTPIASITTAAGQRVIGFSSLEAAPALIIQEGTGARQNHLWVTVGGALSKRCSFAATAAGSGLAFFNGDPLSYDGDAFVVLDRDRCTERSRIGSGIRLINPGSIAVGAGSLFAGPIISGVDVTTARFDSATGAQQKTFASGATLSGQKTNWATSVLVAQLGSSLWSVQRSSGGSEYFLWKTDLDGAPVAVARLPVNTPAVPDLRSPVGLAIGGSGLLLAALADGTSTGPATVAVFAIDISRF